MDVLGSDSNFLAELFNNSELFNAENQLAFHSIESKQELGHNFRAVNSPPMIAFPRRQ